MKIHEIMNNKIGLREEDVSVGQLEENVGWNTVEKFRYSVAV